LLPPIVAFIAFGTSRAASIEDLSLHPDCGHSIGVAGQHAAPGRRHGDE
jgi:hypothetical protein